MKPLEARGGDVLAARLAKYPPRRILILGRDHVGDVVNSTGAIQRIATRYPDAKITVEVGVAGAEILRPLPGLTLWLRPKHTGLFGKLTLVVKAMTWRFDLGVILDDSNEKILQLWLARIPARVGVRKSKYFSMFTASIGFYREGHDLFDSLTGVLKLLDCNPDASPALSIPDIDRINAAAAFDKLERHGLVVGLHPSASCPEKQWAPIHFARVADKLTEQGLTPVLLAGPGDQPLCEEVSRLAGNKLQTVSGLSVLAYAAFLEKVDLLICGDTGPAHLAAAVDTPTVVIYGPTDPVRFGPYGDKASKLGGGGSCRLYDNKCEARTEGLPRCDGRCMGRVSEDQVLEAINRALGVVR